MKARIVVIVTLSGIGLSLRADDATVPPNHIHVQDIDRTIREHLERLDSPSRAEREQAEQALRELGPAILPHLTEAEEFASPHAEEVIERLRLELEQVAASESLQATSVRMPPNATLGEWAHALQDQTGYSLQFSDESLESMQCPDIEGVESITFWQAISFVESAAGIEASRTADGGLVIKPRDRASENWHHDARGAIRVSVSELREIENFIDPEQFARVRMRIRVDVEPKLKGLFLHWAASDLRSAIGDADLIPVGSAGRRELPIPASQRVEFPVDFKVSRDQWERIPEDTGLVITAGSLLVKVATGFRTFEFRHIDEAGSIVRRRGNLAATLESFDASRNDAGDRVWEATLVVDYEGQALDLDSYQLWVFSQEMALLRDNGAVLLPDGERHVSPAAGGAVRMSFIFADELADLASATLIYEAPTAIVDWPVEFEVEGSETRNQRFENRE